MRGDVVRLGLDGGAKLPDRAIRVAERGERHAEVVERAGMSWTNGERPPERTGGVFETAQRRQRVAEVVPRRRVVGLKAQCLFEGVGGVFVTARRRVRVAEVVLRERKPRLQRERVAKAFDRVVETADALVSQRRVVGKGDRFGILPTQALLVEESHLARVLDPAGGSWFVESLTQQLAEAAWAFFQELEAAGGAVAALDSGLVAERVGAVREKR